MEYNLEKIYSNAVEHTKASSLLIYDNKSDILFGEPDDLSFNTRSIAKTVMAIAYGILIEKSNEKYNIDTLIYPYLDNELTINNTKNLEYIKKLKVKHLLTHTMGYDEPLLMSKDISKIDKDKFIIYSLNYPIKYEPGRYFKYSNVGYYILSCLMDKFLNEETYEFINSNLFAKIGITNPRWDRYGSHIAGATKLYLSDLDLLKIGKLLLGKGKFEGINLVASKYIEVMSTPIIKTSSFSKYKYISENRYGLGIWIINEGVIFATGTGGQIIAILPKEEIIIVTTNQGDEGLASLIKDDVEKIISCIKGE